MTITSRVTSAPDESAPPPSLPFLWTDGEGCIWLRTVWDNQEAADVYMNGVPGYPAPGKMLRAHLSTEEAWQRRTAVSVTLTNEAQ